ncbi:bifunctional riboflavin kinase/FAD synthetase [Paraflavitalea soli]|uniref:Riboflavin biosynthesis protein n=1 Tax=Paraflavitalea soli TaxID=2315862 RepID=A0A3B7MKK6_9BACT|nr:bifunctional riboflavin kinase/FAD synthetase [Paraflavitalea soli]AXY74994.1 bifunctional riboflavin kinase/FAD synthetase [Paraflavitalea soli]
MKVYHSTDNIPAFNRAVLTIGTFDGVHLGHWQILEQLQEEARRIGGETVIITFHPHPRKVVSAEQPAFHLLNTIEERIELLEKCGIDHLVIVPFTADFAQQTPEAYIEHFLIEKFHPHTIIIGYDHRFGQGRTGNYKLLEVYSARSGFRLMEIPPHVIDENTVSSTRIRQAILESRIEQANSLLGYDFFFEGTVVEGNKLGRVLGYPTANLRMENEEKLVPGNGIYVVEAEIMDRESAIGNRQSFDSPIALPGTIKGMMSIGIRPTITDNRRTIEVNLFDFNTNIYGRTLRVYVKKYLRAEEKFDGLEALKEQLAKDKEDTLHYFGLNSSS